MTPTLPKTDSARKIQILVVEDEKIIAKIDWNISDSHRASANLWAMLW